jgi:hypothetical protein
MRIGFDHVHIFSSYVWGDRQVLLCNAWDAAVVWDEDASGVRNMRLALGPDCWRIKR